MRVLIFSTPSVRNTSDSEDNPARYYYRGADKSLARPDWNKRLKGRHFSSDAEVIAAAETWLDR